MIRNEKFLSIAEELKPTLFSRRVVRNGDGKPLGRGDTALFDFGEHLTGTVSLKLSYCGLHPDSPVRVILKFAELPGELLEDPASYHGWISSSWVQQEVIHIDILPCEYTLPRRYAFRYLQLEVSDLSSRFSLVVDSVECRAVTSADVSVLEPLRTGDAELDAIDSSACITLKECMQDVFEDGPKRDRRLWLGDLRLQALTNGVTYRNFDLVRRCLCLFAGVTDDRGLLSSCVFTEPEIETDNNFNLDYSLLFVRALADYYEATGDLAFLHMLWPVAKRQLELAHGFYEGYGAFASHRDSARWFIDWNLSLDRDASACGVYLYCLRSAVKLSNILGEDESAALYEAEIEKVRSYALSSFFDHDLGLFVSGPDRQISMASQIWAVLGGMSGDVSLFDRATAAGALPIVSPYLYHYYVEALVSIGEKDRALDIIRFYWGGMLKNGADTFWELYNPDDSKESPYGGIIVNSFCHAWSCTPSYFLRTLLCK